MSEQVRKICLLGPFGVGKTSTAARFVHNSFSEKYLTTVGVKVDTKSVTLDDDTVMKLVIWDVAGTDTATPTWRAYLRGAAGYLLVADGTRPETLNDALRLQTQITTELGDKPWIGLLNKADLKDDWQLEPKRIDALNAESERWLLTSAKTGDAVDLAFARLAAQL